VVPVLRAGWFFVTITVLLIICVFVPGILGKALLALIATLVALTTFAALVGLASRGSVLGIVIDERNRYSMSRLLTAIWSVVVIGSFITFVEMRIMWAVSTDVFAVAVPAELWGAIGITATALVGTPLIRQSKKRKTRGARMKTKIDGSHVKEADGEAAAMDEGFRSATALQTEQKAKPVRTGVSGMVEPAQGTEGTEGQPEVFYDGVVLMNATPQQAMWTDLFRGEEAGNAAAIDIGKLQVFWFTILLAGGYLFAVGQMLAAAQVTIGTTPNMDVLQSLPALSEAFLTLLALSNGTYLVNKAVPHSS
jgi:hypothetical protein